MSDFHPSVLRDHWVQSSSDSQAEWRRELGLGVERDDVPFEIWSLVQEALELRRLEQWSDLRTIEEEMLGLATERMGKAHPVTIRIMTNLAANLSTQGKFVEAITLFEEAYDLSLRILGRSSEVSINCAVNLAATCGCLGRWDAATEVGEEALNLSRRFLGENHPITRRATHNFSLTLQKREMAATGLEMTVHEKRILEEAVQYASSHVPGLHREVKELSESLDRCNKQLDEFLAFDMKPVN